MSFKTLCKLINYWGVTPSESNSQNKDATPFVMPEEAIEILLFWFGNDMNVIGPSNSASQSHGYDLWCERWFAKNKQQELVDFEIQNNFASLIDLALSNQLNHWRDNCYSALALIVLLDQFTRNVHRNTPNAWCGDTMAREVCLHYLNNIPEAVNCLPGIMKLQFYMPLLHAEDIQLQNRSVALYEEILQNSMSSTAKSEQNLQIVYKLGVKIAHFHHFSISTFGRFPERNGLLSKIDPSRQTTNAEKVYLENTISGKVRYMEW